MPHAVQAGWTHVLAGLASVAEAGEELELPIFAGPDPTPALRRPLVRALDGRRAPASSASQPPLATARVCAAC